MTVEHCAAWSSEQNACKKHEAPLKTFGRVRKVASPGIQPLGVSDQGQMIASAFRPEPSAAQRIHLRIGSRDAQ
jgi:hypothetical protein